MKELFIDIDIEGCRREARTIEEVLVENQFVYQLLAESVSNCAPSWKGEDREAFLGKMQRFGEQFVSLKRGTERTIDRINHCLLRAEELESLWG